MADLERVKAELMKRGVLKEPPKPNLEAVKVELEKRGVLSQLASQVKPTLELGGTVFGGLAGAGTGALTSPVTGPVGPLAGGIAGAAVGRAAGTTAGEAFEQIAGLKKPTPLGEQFKQAGQSAVTGAQEQAVGGSIGAGLGAIGKSLAKVANKAAPMAFQTMAKIPENVTKWAQKHDFKLPAYTEEQIDAAVFRVQKSLKDTSKGLGKAEGAAKSALGLDKSFEARLAQLGEEGLDVKGIKQLWKDLDGKLDLADKGKNAIKNRREYAKQLVYLRESIDNAGDYAKKKMSGLTVEETTTLKELRSRVNSMLDKIPEAKSLRKADEEFSEIADVMNELKSVVDDRGKLEKLLRNIFTSDNPIYEKYRDTLAKIENVTGKPLITDLFNKITGREFAKYVGRPGAVNVVAGMGITSAFGGFVPGMVAAGSMLAGQSPKVLGAVAKAGVGASKAGKAALPFVPPLTAAAMDALRSKPLTLNDRLSAESMSEMAKIKAAVNRKK